ncbi:MAG: hypothetical protein ACLU4J_20480 [Butyricimonas paravirosa]
MRLVGIDHVGIGTDFDGDDTEKLTVAELPMK